MDRAAAHAVLKLDARVGAPEHQHEMDGPREGSPGLEGLRSGGPLDAIEESGARATVHACGLPRAAVAVQDEVSARGVLQGKPVAVGRSGQAGGALGDGGDQFVVPRQVAQRQQARDGLARAVVAATHAAHVGAPPRAHDAVAAHVQTSAGHADAIVQARRARGAVSHQLGQGGVESVALGLTMELTLGRLSNEHFPLVLCAPEGHVVEGRALFLSGVGIVKAAGLSVADSVALGRPTATTSFLGVADPPMPWGPSEAAARLVGQAPTARPRARRPGAPHGPAAAQSCPRRPGTSRSQSRRQRAIFAGAATAVMNRVPRCHGRNSFRSAGH